MTYIYGFKVPFCFIDSEKIRKKSEIFFKVTVTVTVTMCGTTSGTMTDTVTVTMIGTMCGTMSDTKNKPDLVRVRR